MYGSWLTLLLFTIGCIVGVLALIKFTKAYYTFYLLYKDSNRTKASMFKELLLNSIAEVLFFILIVEFVIVALVHEPEVSFVGY